MSKRDWSVLQCSCSLRQDPSLVHPSPWGPSWKLPRLQKGDFFCDWCFWAPPYRRKLPNLPFRCLDIIGPFLMFCEYLRFLWGEGEMRQAGWPIRWGFQDVPVPWRACTTPLLHSTTTGPGRGALAWTENFLVPDCNFYQCRAVAQCRSKQVWAEV